MQGGLGRDKDVRPSIKHVNCDKTKETSPTPCKNDKFQLIFAHSATAVTASKKVQL